MKQFLYRQIRRFFRDVYHNEVFLMQVNRDSLNKTIDELESRIYELERIIKRTKIYSKGEHTSMETYFDAWLANQSILDTQLELERIDNRLTRHIKNGKRTVK